jgi:hypothetical protein
MVMRPVAKGVAAFLLGSDTSPLTMAVYGPWGRGKVSCQLQLVWLLCIVLPAHTSHQASSL